MSELLSMDQAFIKKLTSIVLANLDNENFSAEDLAKQAGMSRISLYRKLQSINHQNITQFIRKVRLQRAREMIKNDGGTMSEIAFRVGFGSPAYFIKCFHDYYGYPPGEVKKKEYDKTLESSAHDPERSIRKDQSLGVAVPNAWKIVTYVSFVVIVGLAVLNITSRSNIIKRGSVQSLVILPFGNYTGVDSLDNYIEGMHYLLISEIGKIKGLRVISEVSSNTYKNTDKTIPQIAKELKVDAVIELGVLCYGDMICMQPRLISGDSEEKQLWEGDFSEPKGNLLNVWNQIISQIADKVKLYLTPEEKARLAVSRTLAPEAIDAVAYQEGLNTQLNFSHDTLIIAINRLNHAIEKEPDWAQLYCSLGYVWYWMVLFGYESPDNAYPKVYENINKALGADPDFANTHGLIANIAMSYEHNWEKAETEFKRFLELNPNAPGIRYANLLQRLQRPDEAKKIVDRAYELDPMNPFIQSGYGDELCCLRDYTSAMSFFENQLAAHPNNLGLYSGLENAAFGCGNLKRMFEATKYYLKRQFSFKEEAIDKIQKIYNEKGFIAANEEIIRQLDILVEKGYPLNEELGFRYYVINQDDKAIEYLEKAYNAGQDVTNIGTGAIDYSRLYDNPRFQAILKKMNLPLPKSD